MAFVNFKTFINNLYNILHNEISLKQDILVPGDNITITNGKNISAVDTTYSDATTSKSGLMSSSDKTKLNNIASGAEVNVQSDWEATSGDAFIKNKPSIPEAANNGTLTITQGGATKGTFSANQNSNTVIDIDAGGSSSVFDFVNATTNLNTIRSAGVYAVKAASTSYGRPANYSGIMIVNVSGSTIVQYYYYGYNSKSAATTIYIYKRTSTNSGASWGSWATQ